MTYDVVDVGLGGVGSATAAVLARRGSRVLGPTATGRCTTTAPATATHASCARPTSRARRTSRCCTAPTTCGTSSACSPAPAGCSSAATTAGCWPGARAARAGADLRHGEPATSWRTTTDGVRVTTPRGSYDAGALVVAPGRWAPDLLPDLAVPLRVEDRTMHWFGPAAAAFAPGSFPVWIWERPDGTTPYGVPDVGTGVKASVHHSTLRVAGSWTPDEVGELLAPLLPGLGRRVLRSVPCTCTLTPDENAVVGHHPGQDRVVVACGLSGHGFKLTPVLGEALADLATTGGTSYDLALLDPQRFNAAT